MIMNTQKPFYEKFVKKNSVHQAQDKAHQVRTEEKYQTKIKTPKDKIEIENPEKLTDKEKELILEKVKEYNPNKIIEITEDGFIKLYDRGDKLH